MTGCLPLAFLFDLFLPSLLSVPNFEVHFFSLASDVTLQKVGGSFTSKVPKRTESTSAEKLMVESSIWSQEVSAAHSSSHSCTLVSMTKRNLLTNSVSRDSRAAQ